MNQTATSMPPALIVYPESDGLPMAENTLQFLWIVTLFNNLEALFANDPNVFVCGNQLWYPVEGDPNICTAPDVYVVFGRPKGYRGSYKQWEEGNVPMTVVFEILSPGNTHVEMVEKLTFYEDHGVEEYYEYDPDNNLLMIYCRQGTVFRRVRPAHGFVSPRLGIRFDLSGPEMVVYRPDGQRFFTFDEVQAQLRTAQNELQTAQNELQTAQTRLQRLAELSRKARRGQATPEELAELERLEESPPA